MRASKEKDLKNYAKDSHPKLKTMLNGAPGEIRTPDRLVRSQVLYPAELRAHIYIISKIAVDYHRHKTRCQITLN